jgi:hypothetical protein
MASEAWALAEAVGDPTLTVGLSFPVIYGAIESGEWHEVLRQSQNAIELADGDPSRGSFLVGSPLALAVTTRGIARYFLGLADWRDDLRHGVAIARRTDPATYAGAVSYAYLLGIPFGALNPDDRALNEIEDALRVAERSSDDVVIHFAQAAMAVALMRRDNTAERDRGQSLGSDVRELLLSLKHNLCDLPIVEVHLARERARNGDGDAAVTLMRTACEPVFHDGRPLLWGVPVTGVLVETLLSRGADGDLAEAEAAIERLVAASIGRGYAMNEVWLLRLHALLASAHRDVTAYRDYRNRYRDMAISLGFAGHMKWAEAMP